MAWNRNDAVLWTVLFSINAVWTVSGTSMNQSQVYREWSTLNIWCRNRRIIFNSTKDCEFNILNKELCSFEIAALYNREEKFWDDYEMIGNWRSVSIKYLRDETPYDACRKVGMIVFKEANVAPASTFSFECWMCLVVVLVVMMVVLLAFYILLVKQSPRHRGRDLVGIALNGTNGKESLSEGGGGFINV